MRRLLLVALLAVAAACGSAGTAPTTTTTTTQAALAGTSVPADPPPARYDVVVTPGVQVTAATAAELYTPADPGPWPLVVVVPGGSWRGAEPSSTASLARDLASRGAVVLNAGYRLRAAEAFGDVACAVAVARERAAEWDADPARVVLAGHSAGAHVAAVTALAGTAASADCTATSGEGRPEAFVGIAGPYAVATFAPVPELRRFFGGGPDVVPDAWEAGDPYTYVATNPDLAVALVHGRTDLAVLPVFSLEFAAALRAEGRAVNVYLIPSANHFDVIDAAENAGATSAVILST